MKRSLALITAVISILTFSACGSKEEEIVTTTLPVKVAEQTLQTTTTTALTTTAPVEEEKTVTEIEQTDIELSNMKNNFDDTIDLSLINVNSKWVSIKNAILSDFLYKTGVQKYPWSAISNKENELFFLGNGYGVLTDSNDPTAFNGTLLGIECYTTADKTLAKSVEKERYNLYSVKAVTSSVENTKEDFEISYYSGIKVGMTYEEIQIAFGEKEPESETTTVETSETEIAETTEVFTEEPEETSVEATEAAETFETETTSKKKKTKTTTAPAETSAPNEESENTETVTVVTSDDMITDITEEPAVTPIGDDSFLPDSKESETEPAPEPIPEMIYYKNMSNTLMIYFDSEGIVTKIYLYNNFT